MVRIAHISDSHLGAAMFQLVERKEDMRKCFRQAVEKAISYEPDILVHTGDLFDSHEPSPEDLQTAIALFKKVKDAGIRAFVVQGNHDLVGRRWAVSPVVSLERAGLAYTTIDSQYRALRVNVDGSKVVLHLVSWGPEKTTRRLISEARPNGDINLLFAHTLPIRWEESPLGFNYIGEGHGHNFRLDKELGIGRPGSTAIVEWRREVGYGRTRKLIVIDVSKDGENVYTTEKLEDVREFNISKIDITGHSGEEAHQYLRDKIAKISFKSNGGIAIVQVVGTIDSETDEAIKREELIALGEKDQNTLISFLEPNWDVLGARPFKLTKPLDVETSVKEYVEQSNQGNPEEFLEILKPLIKKR